MVDEQKQTDNKEFFGNSGIDTEVFSKPSLKERVGNSFSNLWYFFTSRSRIFLITAAGVVLLVAVIIILNNWVIPSLQNPPVNENNIQLENAEISQTWLISRSKDSSVSVVHLRNKNKGYGFSNVPFTWRFLDDEGALLSSSQSSTFLLPDQDRFLVLPFTGMLPSKFEIDLLPHKDSFAQSPIGTDFKVEALNINGRNVGSDFVVSGQVGNRTAYVFYEIFVTALVRDFEGNILAAISTQVESVKPGEFKDFVLTWPKNVGSNVSVDVRTEVNVLSDVNFGLPQENDTNSAGDTLR